MKIRGLVEEDFINYGKKPAMFIGTSFCDFKCGKKYCQNSPLAVAPIVEISNKTLVEKYLNNPITKAVVLGGLDPLDTLADTIDFIKEFRERSLDEIIIYTGWTEDEFQTIAKAFQLFPNIIIKFGRFFPDQLSAFDAVLGVELASSNQYAKKL